MKHDTHNTGNIGLYFVCFQLAKRGWNVMPTARNARGVDILASDANGDAITIQVKTLSARNPVNITGAETLKANFLVVVLNARAEGEQSPECYVLKVKAAAKIIVPHATRPWIPVRALGPHRDRWDILWPAAGRQRGRAGGTSR